jgi:hypothetical protein
MEAPMERVERAAVGAQGEPCPQCGSPLAGDQRYCLACGARREGLSAVLSAEARQPATTVRETTAPATKAPVAVASELPWRLDAGLLAGVGCLLLALLVGVLIGRSGAGNDTQRAAAPQVVTVGAAPTAAAGGSSADVAFRPDWPAGKRGFTVQLQTLPKHGTDGTAVAAAKQAATGKGAPDVGALDSDAYASLGGGTYVIYSGQYADRQAAAQASKARKGAFPDAKVIEVSDAGTAKASAGANAATGKAKAPSQAEQQAGAKAIQDVQNASPGEYSKKSAQLPDQLATPGTLPPKDTSKPAGGGSQAETFK